MREQRNAFRHREKFLACSWNALIEAYELSGSTALFDHAGPQLQVEIRG